MAIIEVARASAPRTRVAGGLRVRPARSLRPNHRGWRPAPTGRQPANEGRPETTNGTAPRSGRVVARALLYEYHRHGSLEARQRLIQQYLPLVRRLAAQHAGRGEQLEDLVQVGSIGLINAIDRFELNRGVDLASYAIPSIVGEIKRHLRDRTWPIRIPRRLQELDVSLRTSAVELVADLDRPATVAAVARQVGVGYEEAVEALSAVRSHQPVSLSRGSDGHGHGDRLEAKPTIEAGYEAGEDRAVLAKGFRALDQRERRLLHLAFFEGMSQAQIAREVGISQIHVSRLTRRAIEKMRAEIGSS